MALSVDEILSKSNLLVQETKENSIPPARVGELIYGLAELIKQGSGNAVVIGGGASKLSELKDILFNSLKENDILLFNGTSWVNKILDIQKLSNLSDLFFIDATGNIFTERSFYSKKRLYAYGTGNGESGGGTGGGTSLSVYNALDSLSTSMALSANMGRVLNDRLRSVENGSATSISVTGSGNAVTNLTKSGNQIIAEKGISFALASHAHSWDAITGKPSTFVPSAHIHAISEITNLQGILDSKANSSHPHLWTDVTNRPTALSQFGNDLTSIKIWDNRDAERQPKYYPACSMTAFLNQAIAGMSGNWASGVTFRGWGDGYAAWQLVANATVNTVIKDLYFRTGIDSWESLQKIWTDKNLTSLSQLSNDLNLDSRYVTLLTEQTITGIKTYIEKQYFTKQSTQTSPYQQPICINGTSALDFGSCAAMGFHNPGKNYASLVYDGTFRFMNSAMNGYVGILADALTLVNNGVSSSIWSQNSSHLHYSTDSALGHWFNKDVRVQGEIYAGASYGSRVFHQGFMGANSGLDADLLDGVHLTQFTPNTTGFRDFSAGTLITTNINYNVSMGEPFYLEIKGNTYHRNYACYTQAQGYIYSGTIINFGVTHLGYHPISGLIAKNVNGNLCFWFPRQDYWEGYAITVTTGYDYRINRVTSVSDSAEPAGTKMVDLSGYSRYSAYTDSNVASATKLQTPRTIWGQVFDGTGNVSGNIRDVGHFFRDFEFYFLNNASGAQKICTGGVLCSGNYAHSSIVPANGILALGDIVSSSRAKAPIFDFTNGWTFEAQGAELVAKLNGVVKVKINAEGVFSLARLVAYKKET